MVPGPSRYSYGGGFHDDYDFYHQFDLDDIEDDALRELARQARDAGRAVTLALGGGRYRSALVVSFSACGNTRNVKIDSGNSSTFSAIGLADYEFVCGYHAIWNRRSGTVEAQVRLAAGGSRYVMSHAVNPVALVVTDSAGAAIRFGEPSAAAQGMLHCDPDYIPTITLTDTNVASCEDAADRLNSIGAAFLFQLSLARGYLCSLAELPAITDDPISRHSENIYRWDMELAFPQRSIPPDPLKLFYYAGTLSNEYPSLRFLAYYQVLEYFYVRYSHLDMTESVSSMLRRTGFDATDVDQVARVVDHVLTGARRRGFGSESEQLRATVTRCVDPGRLRAFLLSHEHDGTPLGRHLADPGRLTAVGLVDIDRTEDDKLLADLAKRIYGIRNRIVHAKEGSVDNGPEPLFPFSPESAALLADIEVLRYVAAWVLIESAVSTADRGI